jgi:hypothetical protein
MKLVSNYDLYVIDLHFQDEPFLGTFSKDKEKVKDIVAGIDYDTDLIKNSVILGETISRDALRNFMGEYDIDSLKFKHIEAPRILRQVKKFRKEQQKLQDKEEQQQ